MPITWRNVGGRSNSGANALLTQAGENITGSVDRLRKAGESYGQNLRDANTREFMDQVSQQYGSAEGLAQARESGDLAALRSQYGSLINSEQVNQDAMNERLQSLREQETAQYEWQQAEQERADQPIIDRLKSDVTAQNFAIDPDQRKARESELKKRIRNSGASTGAQNELLSQLQTAVQQGTEQRRADVRWNDTREEKAETEAQEEAYKQADAAARRFMREAGTGQQARALFDEWRRERPELMRRIGSKKRDELITGIDRRFRDAYGLTTREEERLEQEREASDKTVESLIAEEDALLEQAKQQHKVPEVYAYTDGEQTTMGEARQNAMELVDDWNLDSNLNAGLEYVKNGIADAENEEGDQEGQSPSNNANLPKPPEGTQVPWGLITDQAVKNGMEHEWFGDGGDLDQEQFNDAMEQEYLKWLESERSRRAIREAEQARERNVRRIREEARNRVKRFRDSLSSQQRLKQRRNQ